MERRNKYNAKSITRVTYGTQENELVKTVKMAEGSRREISGWLVPPSLLNARIFSMRIVAQRPGKRAITLRRGDESSVQRQINEKGRRPGAL